MTAHIHIITETDDKVPPRYLLRQLMGCWEEQGHLVTTGPNRRLDADVGIIHIDRTWLPPSCIPANPLRRPLLNASVRDISKRRISRNLLSPLSGYAGPVIVKTDANSFGIKDRHYSPHRRLRLRRLRRWLARNGYWQLTRSLPPRKYPIFDNPSAVPGWIWKRKDLVVEKFLPERDKDEFSLRIWMFLGEHEYGVRLFSRDPIVKTENITRFEYIHSVPAQLRKIRTDLGVDYAKFDYVLVDGKPVLLDVNTTPIAQLRRPRSDNVLHLAAGLSRFLQ